MATDHDRRKEPDGGEKPQGTPNLQVRFAAERTLLAWIRTGLGLMGFGFVVARFGLFLQELGQNQKTPVVHSTGISVWIGVALVVLGVSVSLLAAWRYSRVLTQINQGATVTASQWPLGVIVAIVLAAIGAALVAYLIGVGR